MRFFFFFFFFFYLRRLARAAEAAKDDARLESSAHRDRRADDISVAGSRPDEATGQVAEGASGAPEADGADRGAGKPSR